MPTASPTPTRAQEAPGAIASSSSQRASPSISTATERSGAARFSYPRRQACRPAHPRLGLRGRQQRRPGRRRCGRPHGDRAPSPAATSAATLAPPTVAATTPCISSRSSTALFLGAGTWEDGVPPSGGLLRPRRHHLRQRRLPRRRQGLRRLGDLRHRSPARPSVSAIGISYVSTASNAGRPTCKPRTLPAPRSTTFARRAQGSLGPRAGPHRDQRRHAAGPARHLLHGALPFAAAPEPVQRRQRPVRQGFDGTTHTVAGRQRAQYANFSGWDVYRSQLQPMTLLEPAVAADVAQSLLNQAEQNGGEWDRWTHNSGATHVMEGDPSPAAIAGIVAFGGTGFEVASAFASLAHAATVATGARPRRRGLPGGMRRASGPPSTGGWPSTTRPGGGQRLGRRRRDPGRRHRRLQPGAARRKAGRRRRGAPLPGALRLLAQRLEPPCRPCRRLRPGSQRRRHLARLRPRRRRRLRRGQQRRSTAGWCPSTCAASSTPWAATSGPTSASTPSSAAARTFAAPAMPPAPVPANPSSAPASPGDARLLHRLGPHRPRRHPCRVGQRALDRRALALSLFRQAVQHPADRARGGQSPLERSSLRHPRQRRSRRDVVLVRLVCNRDVPRHSGPRRAAARQPPLPAHRRPPRPNGPILTIAAPGAAPDAPYVHGLRIDGTPSTRPWLPESFAATGGRLDFDLATVPDTAWGSAPQATLRAVVPAQELTQGPVSRCLDVHSDGSHLQTWRGIREPAGGHMTEAVPPPAAPGGQRCHWASCSFRTSASSRR